MGTHGRVNMVLGIVVLLVTMAQAAAFSEQCPAPKGNAAPYTAMPSLNTGASIYGTSASIDGTGQYLALGAEDRENYQILNGLVIVYERTGNSWSEMPGMPLLSGTGLAGDQFGRSISLDGNYLVVGGTTQGESSAGAAFAYVRKYDASTMSSTWSTMQTLGNVLHEQHNSFGNSVSLSGEWLAVGAEGELSPETLQHVGAVYLYHRAKSESTGLEEYTEKSSFYGGGSINANFGSSVSLEGNYLVVGANAENGNTGAVYVYFRSGASWSLMPDMPLRGTSQSNFGDSVSLSGKYLGVGAPITGLTGAGAAHIFVRNGTKWTAQWQMGGNGVFSNAFGIGVALSGNYFVVTAQDEATNKGHAYMWYRNGTTWGQKSEYGSDLGAPIPSAVALTGSSLVVVSHEPFGYSCNPQHTSAPTTSTPTTAPAAPAVASSGWSAGTYGAVFGSVAAVLVLVVIAAVIYARKNIRWRWVNLDEADVDGTQLSVSLAQHAGADVVMERNSGVGVASHPHSAVHVHGAV